VDTESNKTSPKISAKKTLSVDKKKVIAGVNSALPVGSSFIKVTTTFLKDEPRSTRSSRSKSLSKSAKSSASKSKPSSSKKAKIIKIVRSGKSTPKSVGKNSS
jgi:hypothetical protein